mmetsp:Transcript_28112/g.90529  ORF Transcript_28112/g.90529 Transcript_28112/m.90529 type:complete len:110 (-) Transcript_28112:1365-1694(-)
MLKQGLLSKTWSSLNCAPEPPNMDLERNDAAAVLEQELDDIDLGSSDLCAANSESTSKESRTGSLQVGGGRLVANAWAQEPGATPTTSPRSSVSILAALNEEFPSSINP